MKIQNFLLLALLLLFLPRIILADSVIDNGTNFLKSKQDSTGKITGGFSAPSQWAAIAFAANGVDITTIKNPTNSLKDFLLTDIPTNSTATDWENRILAITAIGGDPSNFGGMNYLSKLESFYKNGQIGDTCALNDDIFGLLALIASGTSANAQIKQDTLDFIISKQDPSGGFSWVASGCPYYGASSDMTAAAIQALQAAKDNNLTNANLDTAISKAKDYLLTNQNSDGGFPGYSGSDSTTTAQALTALSGKGWILKVASVSATPLATPSASVAPTPTPTPEVLGIHQVSPTPALQPTKPNFKRIYLSIFSFLNFAAAAIFWKFKL